MLIVMSLMYNRKSIGPSTEPWGALDVTVELNMKGSLANFKYMYSHTVGTTVDNKNYLSVYIGISLFCLSFCMVISFFLPISYAQDFALSFNI